MSSDQQITSNKGGYFLCLRFVYIVCGVLWGSTFVKSYAEISCNTWCCFCELVRGCVVICFFVCCGGWILFYDTQLNSTLILKNSTQSESTFYLLDVYYFYGGWLLLYYKLSLSFWAIWEYGRRGLYFGTEKRLFLVNTDDWTKVFQVEGVCCELLLLC